MAGVFYLVRYNGAGEVEAVGQADYWAMAEELKKQGFRLCSKDYFLWAAQQINPTKTDDDRQMRRSSALTE
jgi:hypothetical protein